MTDPAPQILDLPTEADTIRLGESLAKIAKRGDCILLEGPIGAGKSTLARAFIRARLGRMEDVPSPTFTLVQVYDAGAVEIWHADLYRLSHPDEVWELGLDTAFDESICLIEWPDRLGQHVPKGALRVRLEATGEGRRAVISGGQSPRYRSSLEKVERKVMADRFLVSSGWGAADRQHLAGDASDRRYERLRLGAATAVLMDNPPGGADDPGAFLAMAGHLRSLGLSAPEVRAADIQTGFLLLEDLGDDLYSRLLATEPSREAELYAPAVDVLCHLQAAPAPVGLPDLSAADWASAADLAMVQYAAAATGQWPDPGPYLKALEQALSTHADGPRVLILRDYHADNLLWLPGRDGLRRVGLLDFQLAQMGQPAYDLVSLLQDARRDVSLATEVAMVARFCQVTGADPDRFAAQYAAVGAQRALRILGVFVRLARVRAKPGYLPLLPRVWGQLQRNLAHPSLASLRDICTDVLPEPTPETLDRIRAQCPPTPSH
ncbi:MAG: tRNA (adenosine(37)-N6)-threonylcarbamoyltransferase complex ATPase subunit type 1 TsaE [Tabrizicola sp.]|jgi:hypothetical protein|nr:tRNA (adenosine(37)-N6)-threonylcarbamoyltransferase complex ATPase subunit type 1 TsaE [Tabrizicola sp.]